MRCRCDSGVESSTRKYESRNVSRPAIREAHHKENNYYFS